MNLKDTNNRESVSSSSLHLSHVITIPLFYTILPLPLLLLERPGEILFSQICIPGSPSPSFLSLLKYVLFYFESSGTEGVRDVTWKAYKKWNFKNVSVAMTLIYFTLKNKTKQNPQTKKKNITATFLKAVSFLTNNTGLVGVLIAEETAYSE